MEEIKNGLYDAFTADMELAEELEAELACLEKTYGVPVLGLIPKAPVRKRLLFRRKKELEREQEEERDDG